MAPSRRGTKAKTHVLKNTDLNTIIEPADQNEVAFTATKGELSLSLLRSKNLARRERIAFQIVCIT